MALPTSFSVSNYLNSVFPSTDSLSDLPAFTSNIDAALSSLETSITKSITEEGARGNELSLSVTTSANAVATLQSKVESIRTRAYESETMVKEICRDIKQLDCAKRHLMSTITGLKRLHMLVSAVDQLTSAAEEKRFRDASHLLQAVQELNEYFKDYKSVPKIAEIRNAVDSVRNDLTRDIFNAFNEIGNLAATTANPDKFEITEAHPGQFKSLGEACLVVDALGAKARRRQIDDFITTQLREYSRTFSGEAASLAQVDRRFAWFRRLSKSVNEQFSSVFPARWKLPRKLCLAFLRQTRAHFKTILSAGGSEAENVTVLLQALQKSVLFEKEMEQRFEREEVAAGIAVGGAGGGGGGDFTDDGKKVDPNSAEGIKLKYARANAAKDSKLASTQSATNVVDDGEENLTTIKTLSTVFQPFMSPYIALERSNIEEQLAKVMTNTDVDTRGGFPVLTSSNELFVYMNNSIKRCTALTTGSTFFELYKMMKRALHEYVKLLSGKLPSPVTSSSTLSIMSSSKSGMEASSSSLSLSSSSSSSSSTPNNAAKESVYRIPLGNEVIICHVIDTCEYCDKTVETLQEIIAEKIDDEYKDKVDLSDVQDGFADLTALCLKVLVGGLASRVEPAWKELTAVRWGEFSDVGEESKYTSTINSAVVPFIMAINKPMPASYFRNFCDKFASSFVNHLHNMVIKQRRISETGAQQLLLDVYNLKTLTLKIPSLGNNDSIASTMFTKQVNNDFGKLEMLLKLIGTPATLLVDVFKTNYPDADGKELVVVMTLKGMKRAEMSEQLETLGVSSSLVDSVSVGSSSTINTDAIKSKYKAWSSKS